MKKQQFEYDYKFDWIVRKNRNKEIQPDKEDYKRRLREKLEGEEAQKQRRNNKDGDEEEDELR